MGDLSQHLEGLTNEQGELLRQMEGLAADMEADNADKTAMKAQLGEMATQLATVTEAEEKRKTETSSNADLDAVIKLLQDRSRTPSKGLTIGNPNKTGSGNLLLETPFFWSVWAARNTRSPEFHEIGKAALEEYGSAYSGIPEYSKATLGDTAGAGGNLVPPNVLGPLIEIATAVNPYRELLTVLDAGFVPGVDVPTEGLAPVRATVQAYGATKTNIALTTNKYTATMYTIAAIYDIGNQLLRNSRGLAERLVRTRLTRSIALAESYYILQGSGTNEPKGILTSIGTSGTFVTSHTASATTLAGSAATAIAKATGDLAGRSRQPDGVVVNATDFWIMAAQGTDTAGFFLAPAAGPAAIDPTRGLIRIWGLPVYADANMPADSLVVGEWKSATLFTGQTYRVDVSDTAGTRWDTNETGFRGEEEIGFNADPYVSSGLFQRIVDVRV